MGATDYDVLVIGGGPGGSASSSFLAKAGKKVLLLEKEVFPRFHIGESLLPYNRRIFRELGLTEIIEAENFPKKFGAQFYIADGSRHQGFVFQNGVFTKEKVAMQVERAKFDHILLKHARSLGVDAREGWTVHKFREFADHVEIEATGPDGKTESFSASFLIDASGRSNLTGNQQGTKVMHPHLKKLAIFGHFKNVKLDEGSSGGDTIIVRLEKQWFWLIPISKEKTSVGCVMDQADFARFKEEPPKIFERICQSSAVMREKMGSAEAVAPLQVTSDFSYYNKRYVGERLLRVGDAAGFMDPIFSAGVYLAMYSGKKASEAICDVLDRGKNVARRLNRYEKDVKDSMKFYWEMVHQFYTTPFLEILFHPKEKFMLASAVNAALAGELEGDLALRWRMRLFFWFVRAQKHLGFAPRISFGQA